MKLCLMGFDEGRNEFEEILGEKSSDENYIMMDTGVGVEGYMVIAISKLLGCSKEAINKGMIVNANSRQE